MLLAEQLTKQSGGRLCAREDEDVFVEARCVVAFVEPV